MGVHFDQCRVCQLVKLCMIVVALWSEPCTTCESFVHIWCDIYAHYLILLKPSVSFLSFVLQPKWWSSRNKFSQLWLYTIYETIFKKKGNFYVFGSLLEHIIKIWGFGKNFIKINWRTQRIEGSVAHLWHDDSRRDNSHQWIWAFVP